MPGFRREGAFSPAMTTRVRNVRRGTTYKLLKTCDQMAIMPMNSASDASAAASWITALNMVLSIERSENIVHVMFFCQAWRWPLSTSSRKQWFLLRKAAERSIPALWDRIGSILDLFSPRECLNFFNHAGYA